MAHGEAENTREEQSEKAAQLAGACYQALAGVVRQTKRLCSGSHRSVHSINDKASTPGGGLGK